MKALSKHFETFAPERLLTVLCFLLACAFMVFALISSANADPAHPVSLANKRFSTMPKADNSEQHSACAGQHDHCSRPESALHLDFEPVG